MKKILLAAIIFMSIFSVGYAQCTPSVTIYSSPSGPICQGMAVTFTAVPTNGGTPTYKWTSSLNGILSSTANTYTSVTLTNGEVISVEMTSSLGCASPTTAISSVTMSVYPIVNPYVTITADKTVTCVGEATTFTASPINGGGVPSYQWLKNGAPIPSATNSTYTTTASVNGDAYTVEMISSNICAIPPKVTSAAIQITVKPTPTINISIVSNVSGTCANNPVVFTATVSGTGTTPAPTYEWFVTSASVPGPPAVSQGAPNTTATTFTTSALTPTHNKVYVQVVSNAACASTTSVASNVMSITVNTGIAPGLIGSDQTICYNGTASTLTELTASNAVTPTYQWEAAPSPAGIFTTIPSATNATYNPPLIGLTQDLYIRRVITDPGTPAPCNVATSNIVHITVRPQLVAGIIGSDESTCSGSATTTMTQTTVPTGGTGTYTYQWQSAPDVAGAPGTFSNINPGGTGPTYNAGNLTQTMYYRLIQTSGASCGSMTSNVVTKTITAPEVVTVSINDPGQLCAASAPFTFTATASTTGTGTLSYQWFLGTILVGTNSANYSYTPVLGDDNKTVRVVVTTSNGCNAGPANSNVVTLDIVGATTPTISISGNSVNCIGLPTTFTATSTGGGPAPTYVWYVVPSGSPLGTIGNPVGTTGTTYTTSTLQNGDRVYVELTSYLSCIIGANPFKSNEIIMVVKPVPSPAITEGDQTICTPNSFTFHGNVTAGNYYEWRKLPSNTALGTGADFTASQSGSYYIYEENGTCNTSSAPVTLTVDPCGAFSTAISGPNPITPGQQNAVYSVPNQIGFTYTWSITGGTIVSGQNTNSVTVDWDATTTNAFARTTATSYSISVVEKNPTNQTKTTTSTINTITTGTTLSQAQSGINVFPNPTTGSFNIEMPESGMDVSYEILDLTGRSVASGTFTSTGSDQKIDANMGAGMYQVVLKYNNVVTCVRLSKVQ